MATCASSKSISIILSAAYVVPEVIEYLQHGISITAINDVAKAITDVVGTDNTDTIRYLLDNNEDGLIDRVIASIANIPVTYTHVPEADNAEAPEVMAHDLYKSLPNRQDRTPHTLGSISNGFTRSTFNKTGIILLAASWVTMLGMVGLLVFANVDGSTATGGALLAITIQFANNFTTAFNYLFGGSASNENMMMEMQSAASRHTVNR